MWHDFGVAIALVLILEGFLPFLSPEYLRRKMLQFAKLNDGTLRFGGLSAMVLGCLLLYLIK